MDKKKLKGEFKMKVKHLIRQLEEMEPESNIHIEKGKNLIIGNNFAIRIPSKIEKEIEKMYLERQGINDTE
jgi:hypothetical protein